MWYFSCQLGDGLCHRSHLLGEPFQQPLSGWPEDDSLSHLMELQCPGDACDETAETGICR